MSESVGSRALEALRAVALNSRGMRLLTHSEAMPTLVGLGYVTQHQARWEGAQPNEMAWFITPYGRELLWVLGNVGFEQRT